MNFVECYHPHHHVYNTAAPVVIIRNGSFSRIKCLLSYLFNTGFLKVNLLVGGCHGGSC